MYEIHRKLNILLIGFNLQSINLGVVTSLLSCQTIILFKYRLLLYIYKALYPHAFLHIYNCIAF